MCYDRVKHLDKKKKKQKHTHNPSKRERDAVHTPNMATPLPSFRWGVCLSALPTWQEIRPLKSFIMTQAWSY